MKTKFAQNSGINVNKIEVDVTYKKSGSILVNKPKNISNVQLAQKMKKSIAKNLGLKTRDVKITITGNKVQYDISADSFESAQSLGTQLQTSMNNITTSVAKEYPTFDVTKINDDSETSSSFEINTDTSPNPIDPQAAAKALSEGNNDFQVVSSEGNFSSCLIFQNKT